jgi:hypothetical protein
MCLQNNLKQYYYCQAKRLFKNLDLLNIVLIGGSELRAKIVFWVELRAWFFYNRVKLRARFFVTEPSCVRDTVLMPHGVPDHTFFADNFFFYL